MFAQPLAGIMMSQAAGFPVSFFGFFELPVFLDKDPELAKTFLSIHGTVWILLVIAVIGHAGAALHHHFIRKDNVLKQMTTGAWSGKVEHLINLEDKKWNDYLYNLGEKYENKKSGCSDDVVSFPSFMGRWTYCK